MNIAPSDSALTVPGPRLNNGFAQAMNLFRLSNDSVGYTRQLFETYGAIVSLRYGDGTNIYSPLPWAGAR